MRKYIKIFLASSIIEFERQRLEMEAYIGKLNNIYIHRDIYFELIVCEDLTNSLSIKRKQEDYNQKIRESQFFYVLFGKEAGEYTIEEFDIALEQFRKSGAPRIYTYFKRMPEGNRGASVKQFMRRLDQELGHYYSVFDHIDSIKLNLLLELTRYSDDSENVKFEGGTATLNGDPVLSLENVPIYAKNEELNRWRSELESAQRALANAAAEYSKNPADQKARKILSEASAHCNELMEAIAKIEEQMLKLCSMIVERNSAGAPMTWREKEASRLLENGDYKGALAVLRLAERKKDVDRLKMRKEQLIQEATALIGETRLRIQTLLAEGLNSETVDEITECYEETIPLAEEYHVELEILYEYALFLAMHHGIERGIELAERLNHYYELDEPDMRHRFFLQDLRGKLYYGQNDFLKSEEAYRKAMDLGDRMEAAEPSDVNKNNAALVRNGLAMTLMQIKKYEEAEELWREAIEILEGLQDQSLVNYYLGMADLHGNRAVMFKQMGRYKEAEKGYRLAFEQYRHIEAEFSDVPHIMDSEIAINFYNRANLLCEQEKRKKAEKLYRASLKLYKGLAAENPAAYETMEAGVKTSLATLLAETGRVKESVQLLKEATDTYRLYLTGNVRAYGQDFTKICCSYAELQVELQQYEEAEKALREVLQVHKELAEWNPDMYLGELGLTYDQLARLLYRLGRYSESEELCQENLKILEKLIETNPKEYEGQYATVCTNEAANLKMMKQYGKARKYFRKALEIYMRLAEKEPEKYEPEVAYTNFCLAEMFYGQGQKK